MGTPEPKRNRNRRKHLRFAADQLQHALVDPIAGAGDFRPELVALIADESRGGCRLIVLADGVSLRSGSRCRVALGSAPPIGGTVRWRQDLDEQVSSVGIEYDPPPGTGAANQA